MRDVIVRWSSTAARIAASFRVGSSRKFRLADFCRLSFITYRHCVDNGVRCRYRILASKTQAGPDGASTHSGTVQRNAMRKKGNP